jgi:hypothetical protein
MKPNEVDPFIEAILMNKRETLRGYVVLANWLLLGPVTDIRDLRRAIAYDFHNLLNEEINDIEIDRLLEKMRLEMMNIKQPRVRQNTQSRKLKEMLSRIKQ